LVAKNGEFRYMVFGIRNNLCLFARIRYKMTSKMIANGRFWMGDCLLDRAVIRENRRNPFLPPDRGLFPTGTDGDFTLNHGDAAGL